MIALRNRRKLRNHMGEAQMGKLWKWMLPLRIVEKSATLILSKVKSNWATNQMHATETSAGLHASCLIGIFQTSEAESSVRRSTSLNFRIQFWTLVRFGSVDHVTPHTVEEAKAMSASGGKLKVLTSTDQVIIIIVMVVIIIVVVLVIIFILTSPDQGATDNHQRQSHVKIGFQVCCGSSDKDGCGGGTQPAALSGRFDAFFVSF